MEEAWAVGISQTGPILCSNPSLARISIFKTHPLPGFVNQVMARGWVMCTEEGEIFDKFRHGSGFLGKEACLRVNPRRCGVPAGRTPQRATSIAYQTPCFFGTVSNSATPASRELRIPIDGEWPRSLFSEKQSWAYSFDSNPHWGDAQRGWTHACPRGRGRADQMMRDYQISTCRFQIALSEMVFWPCSIAHRSMPDCCRIPVFVPAEMGGCSLQ